MSIRNQVDLKDKHTFSTQAIAKEYVEVEDLSQAKEVLRYWKDEPYLILGGGSNLLFLNSLVDRVLKVNLQGWMPIAETDEHVWVDVAAGVLWHDWVMQSLEQGWYGLENLALIPGNVGASPMQNIGAYGVEVGEYVDSVEVIDRGSIQLQRIESRDCSFAYRSSAFKTHWKNKFLICSVRFKLCKRKHKLRTEYGAIKEELLKMGISPELAGAKDVAEAVMSIRRSKLPDPKEIGNAGSFFKNPSVPKHIAQALLEKHPEMPQYSSENKDMVKLAAGWLIEQSGLKGIRDGDAGVHSKQALVLVNWRFASGEQIWKLALQIQKKVRSQFGVDLEPEVNAI
jgi:UDP-N-acetylmuramate dehydrogenase